MSEAMESKVKEGKIMWNNTMKAYKAQKTQLDNKIGQIEVEIGRALDDPDLEMKRFTDWEVLFDSCRRKVELLEGYLNKLAGLQSKEDKREEALLLVAKVHRQLQAEPLFENEKDK